MEPEPTHLSSHLFASVHPAQILRPGMLHADKGRNTVLLPLRALHGKKKKRLFNEVGVARRTDRFGAQGAVWERRVWTGLSRGAGKGL